MITFLLAVVFFFIVLALMFEVSQCGDDASSYLRYFENDDDDFDDVA